MKHIMRAGWAAWNEIFITPHPCSPANDTADDLPRPHKSSCSAMGREQIGDKRASGTRGCSERDAGEGMGRREVPSRGTPSQSPFPSRKGATATGAMVCGHGGALKSQGAGQGVQLLHPREQIWGVDTGPPVCPLLLGTLASVTSSQRAVGGEHLPGGTQQRGAIAAGRAN